MSQPAPLTTQLAWTWIAHTIEADNMVETVSAERVGRHFRISLPMWANGLRVIGEDGVTVDQLRDRARAACNIGGLERWGWISVGDPGTVRRDGYGSHRGVTGSTVVRPTRAGRYAQRLWPRVLGEVERRWRTRFGDETIETLTDALRARAPSMPWSPPEVAPSDGFFTHVRAGEAVDGQVPLAALLGQALTAATLAHEQRSAVSLPLGANLLRVIGSESVRLRDLPARAGISKEASAMAASYLQRSGLAAAVADRAIALTPAGLDALDGYAHEVSRSADPALRDALTPLLAQTGPLSAGLVPAPGCWRAANPYLAQTRRLLADPTAALPWHPMVLHRGGWPDGS